MQAQCGPSPRLGTALLFRRAMYQQESGRRENRCYSIGRVGGWRAAPRHGCVTAWARTGKRRSANARTTSMRMHLTRRPAMRSHSEAAWLVAQKVNQQSKIYLYVPNGQLVSGSGFARSNIYCVLAQSTGDRHRGNRFVVADTLLGGTGTPSCKS